MRTCEQSTIRIDDCLRNNFELAVIRQQAVAFGLNIARLRVDADRHTARDECKANVSGDGCIYERHGTPVVASANHLPRTIAVSTCAHRAGVCAVGGVGARRTPPRASVVAEETSVVGVKPLVQSDSRWRERESSKLAVGEHMAEVCKTSPSQGQRAES